MQKKDPPAQNNKQEARSTKTVARRRRDMMNFGAADEEVVVPTASWVYSLPIVVNFPFASSIGTLGPTLETLDRKEPKYEYRSTQLINVSQYNADHFKAERTYSVLSNQLALMLKKDCVEAKSWFASAYSVTHCGMVGYAVLY